ncbi:MAG: ABC transporter substrate-binding protein [Cyanobacteria bacterium SZAS TMP-1]|nr:ABC transporter substrate-binding protein [Cyanobacteria bacterium SZAS TMP-1]
MSVTLKEIRIAHSPDSDDAFMFYALAKNKLDTKGLTVTQVMKDIQTLNQEAMQGLYEVTAISFAAYPHVKDRYKLASCGSSMGDNYGPKVVAPAGVTKDDLKNMTVAIPGKMTTAYLLMQMWCPGLKVEEVPFDQIIDVVLAGKYGAGLIIHEGQLTYSRDGLSKIVDLGEWWHAETGLPLPLGGNAIRKDLGEEMMQTAADIFKRSVIYSLEHREEALEYALGFARDMTTELADEFVKMYANERSVDCGDVGREAVRRLFAMGHEKGLYKELIVPEFVS